MTKLKTMILAMALLAPIAAQAASPPTKMYPDFYEYFWRMAQCTTLPYFECNYTSKTCLRGYATTSFDLFAGVLLAEDRQKVLAHLIQRGGIWLNADTGEVQFPDGRRANEPDYFKINPEWLAQRRADHNCFPGRAYEPPPE